MSFRKRPFLSGGGDGAVGEVSGEWNVSEMGLKALDAVLLFSVLEEEEGLEPWPTFCSLVAAFMAVFSLDFDDGGPAEIYNRRSITIPTRHLNHENGRFGREKNTSNSTNNNDFN